MPFEARVQEWLRKMGYNGELPASLNKICHPSTAAVWEQLITNVRPRQEIRHIKNSLIVSRLSKKSLDKQDQFSYPILEIDRCMEKSRLEKRVEYLERAVEEKYTEIDEILSKNKIIYANIDHVKAKTREKQDRTYLLESKSKMLETDIQKAQEVLSLAKYLTPVEMEATENEEEITKTLQQCAAKLQSLSETVTLSKTNRSFTTPLVKSFKTPKQSKMLSFSDCLSRTRVLNSIAPSCRKPSVENKKTLHAVPRCLKLSDSSETPYRRSNRESLGILSPSLLTISDEVDTLLLDTNQHESWNLENLSDTLLEPQNTRNQLVKTLKGHDVVKKLLTNLLHQNNRYLIVRECKRVYEELFGKLNVSLMQCNCLRSTNHSITRSDLLELYFMHIEAELEKEKCRIIIKNRLDAVKKKKEDIFFQMSNKSENKEEIKRALDFEIEKAYMLGANSVLRQEVNSAKPVGIDHEIELLNIKILQLKEEIAEKCDDIQTLVLDNETLFKDIQKNEIQACDYVRSLIPYASNLNWANELTKGAISEELEMFKKFPLEFNRKFTHNNSQVYYHSFSHTTVPSYVKLDSNDMSMFTSLVKTPYKSAENVVFDLCQTKNMGKKLESMKPEAESLDVSYSKYSLETLHKRENFVDTAINELELILDSKEAKEILSLPNALDEVMQLWEEMPFRKYVSAEREVDGHEYMFYEKKLEEMKKNQS